MMTKYRVMNPETKQYEERTREKKGEIHFENDVQLAIWCNEIRGQLSDGHWENDSSTDWVHWFDLDPVSDGTIGWKRYDDYVPMRWSGYAGDMYELADCLGDRMTGYAKAVLLGANPENERECNFVESLCNQEKSYGVDLYWDNEEYADLRKKYEDKYGSLNLFQVAYDEAAYGADRLEADLHRIAESMGTSLRKIGYLG